MIIVSPEFKVAELIPLLRLLDAKLVHQKGGDILIAPRTANRKPTSADNVVRLGHARLLRDTQGRHDDPTHAPAG